LGELLAGLLIDPVNFLFSFRELSLNYLVHRMLEAISGGESFKTLVTAVVLM
jgi:hypothetical protein